MSALNTNPSPDHSSSPSTHPPHSSIHPRATCLVVGLGEGCHKVEQAPLVQGVKGEDIDADLGVPLRGNHGAGGRGVLTTRVAVWRVRIW